MDGKPQLQLFVNYGIVQLQRAAVPTLSDLVMSVLHSCKGLQGWAEG